MEKKKTDLKEKVMDVVGGVLSFVFVITLIINCALIISSMMNKDRIPSISGVCPLIVLTDSMNPEFYSGDLIICKQTDIKDIHVGDVIAYFNPNDNRKSIITHRVKEIAVEEKGVVLKTKGDANNVADDKKVYEDLIIGVYKARIPYLGHIALFMQSQIGLIICVFMPAFLFVMYEMYRRSKEVQALKNELNQMKSFKQLEE